MLTLIIPCSPTRLSGVVVAVLVLVRIMGIKDMSLMDMLLLLRTLICITGITQDMLIISSHNRYDKSGLEGPSYLPFLHAQSFHFLSSLGVRWDFLMANLAYSSTLFTHLLFSFAVMLLIFKEAK